MKKNLLLIAMLFFALPVLADTYALDPAHASVGFCAKHLVISTVCGKFTDFTADIEFDPKNIANSSLSGSIKVASISTGNEKRDGHLKSADFFDADKFPEITFKSSKIEKAGDGYMMTGTLTMKGVSKEIKMPFTVNGPVNAFGGTRIGVSASTTVNRQDYGVSWNQKLDSGGVVVSDEIKIQLDAEAAKK